MLWIVLYAFGIGLDPGQAMLVYGTAKVVAGLPVTPGGLGLVEGGMIGLLTAMGFRTEAVLAPVLIYQILDYWFLALLGLVAASRVSGRRLTRPFRRPAAMEGPADRHDGGCGSSGVANTEE